MGKMTTGSSNQQDKGHFAWRAGRFARSQVKRTFGGWGKDIKKYRIKRKKKQNISPFHENMDFNFGSSSVVDFSSTSGAWDSW